MASADATIQIVLSPEDRDLLKAGRRNSASDKGRILKLKSHLEDSLEIIGELGVAEEKEDEVDDGEKEAAKAAPVGEAEAEATPPEDTAKALPLDKQVNAVIDAVGKLNRNGMYREKPYDEWVQMAACYDGYCIIREGLSHYKATYTLEDMCCSLCDRSEWEKVELDWKPVGDTEKAIPETMLIKSLGNGRIGHYGVVWGSEKKRDLYREWFDKDTAEMDVIFKAIGKIPLLYHHAMDGSLKTSVVGVVEKMVADDVGLWLESQIDMANAYAQAITGLVHAKALGTSTGTLPGGRAVNKSTGKIVRWPIVEASLTPTPAEPRMRQDFAVAELKSYFSDAGLRFPDQFTKDTGAEEARPNDDLALERERLSLLTLTV